ncbi:phage tail assembly chaperone [Dyella japonica]|uniref:Bacteriophage protein n=1 Tax=Dyella japonica TaxID=231455 RepID=A0ABV2JZ35_9GAMM
MDFEINGQQYRSGKLNARQQFHVARRLAPVLGGLATASQGKTDDFATFLQPIADAIAGMSDADCDYVLDTCLAIVQRQQGSSWANIFVNKAQMFDDIDMGVMLQIASKVITENLGSFFQGSAASLLNTPTTAA